MRRINLTLKNSSGDIKKNLRLIVENVSAYGSQFKTGYREGMEGEVRGIQVEEDGSWVAFNGGGHTYRVEEGVDEIDALMDETETP